jgi:DnaJ-class molecular chaperone
MCPNCDGKGEITRTDKLIAADTEEKVTGGVIRRTEQCMRCSARGYLQGEPCQRCDGEGVVGCPSCEGKGYKTCKTCRGIGKLTSEEMERYERRQLIHGIIIAAAFLLIVGLVVWAICQAK